jgi:hypothetical protein
MTVKKVYLKILMDLCISCTPEYDKVVFGMLFVCKYVCSPC